MVSSSSTPGANPWRPDGSARRILCPPRAPLPRQIRSAPRPQVIPVQRSRLKEPAGGQHDVLKPSASQFSRGWTRHSRLIATTIAAWVARRKTVGTKYRVRLIGREAPWSFRWALADLSRLGQFEGRMWLTSLDRALGGLHYREDGAAI